MFKLFLYMMLIPLYMIFWMIKLYIYIFVTIFKFAITLCEPKKKKSRKENWDIVNNITVDLENRSYKDIFNTKSNEEYERIEKLKSKEIEESGYELVRPEEKEYKIMASNIESMYKDLGYNVKVTDIIRTRYNTAYEVIFSKIETSQYEMLSVSDTIKNNFDIDGIDIKPKKKSDNKIIIYIPLKYKNVQITLEDTNKDEVDPLLEEAINLVVEIGSATASIIQRRFKVGYARAGKIIDQMETRGIISGYQGNKPRDVLMTKETWQRIKNNMNN